MRKFQWWMLDGDEADHIRMQVRYGENGPDSVLADLEFVVPEWFDLDLLMTPDGTGDVSVLEAQLEHAQQVAEELMQPLQEPLRASLPASLVIRFPASGFAARDWIESIPWEIIPFRFVDEDHETPPVLGHQFVSIADIRGDLSEDDLNDARRTPILMIERPAFSTDHAHRVDGIEGRVQTVFFGTNRNLTVRRGYVFDDGYGQVQVAPGMSHLRTGRCDVWVPAGHQTGQLRGDGWGRWFGLPADALEIRELQLLGSEILDEMRRVLSIDGPDRHHMLFIHGFNVSFADALLRTAQLGTDLGIQGVASAFCWPSLNFQNHLLQRYRIEEHRIRASEAALAEWIGQLSQLDGQLHVIAHSMGNRGMLESVHRALDGKNVRDGGIGQLIFTAPDVEQGDFVSRAARLAGKSNRMTLYASNKDRALGWSKRLSGFSVRAGLMPPPTILDGLDTILVEHPAPLFSFGHSYYADHQPLLDDIRRLIEHNEQPSTPERSLELDSSRQYWLMR